MTKIDHARTALSLPEQLQRLVQNAKLARSEPFDKLKDELSRKLLCLRPSVGGISLISCCEETPQLGFPRISMSNLGKVMEKQLPLPGRNTSEKRLQSWLIQHALKSRGRLEMLDCLLGGQYWYVSDEIALKKDSEKLVADLLLARIDVNGMATLVNAELKSERLMKTFAQVISFRTAIEDPELQKGWKEFAEIMIGKTFQWHPAPETRGIVIWPATRENATSTLADKKRTVYERIDVIGYREGDDYTLESECSGKKARG